MTPQDFIAKWGAPGGHPGPAYHLNEEQGAQSHFLDLCELLDVPDDEILQRLLALNLVRSGGKDKTVTGAGKP
jgi:hypothetical protein